MRLALLSGVALIGSAILAADVAGQSRATDIKVSPQAVLVPNVSRPADAVSRPKAASALTAMECHWLGGEYVTGDEIAGQCASGAYCRTFDGKGEAHRVCIAAAN